MTSSNLACSSEPPATTIPSGAAPSIPEKFSTDKMLAYYAERFSTVEINYTFYRMPTEKLLAGLGGRHARQLHVHAQGAAADHPRREAAALRGSDCRPSARPRRRSAPKLGDAAVPAAADLQEGPRASSRVRRRCCPMGHAPRSSSATRPGSTPTSSSVLRARNLALCVADSEKMSTPVEMTADYAYFRLRDEGYQQADIERWAGVIRELHGHQGRVRVLQARRAGTGAGVRDAVAWRCRRCRVRGRELERSARSAQYPSSPSVAARSTNRSGRRGA